MRPHPHAVSRFSDRVSAGRQLAGELLAEGLVAHGHTETVVLGLPRGGVPVAAEVARALGAPLDVLVVRKLGHPRQPELAMGALAPDDAAILNPSIAEAVSSDAFEHVVQQERGELARREHRYLGERTRPALRGKRIVLVDDGVATGATMRAAVASVRKQAPARVIVAVPVGPADSLAQLAREADDVVCLLTPEDFGAISLWYDDFAQVNDSEVEDALRAAVHAETSAAQSPATKVVPDAAMQADAAWAKMATEPQPTDRVIRPP